MSLFYQRHEAAMKLSNKDVLGLDWLKSLNIKMKVHIRSVTTAILCNSECMPHYYKHVVFSFSLHISAQCLSQTGSDWDLCDVLFLVITFGLRCQLESVWTWEPVLLRIHSAQVAQLHLD